jgi:L-seryl-tRNA(Ser) seleniumtransferase
MSSPLLRMIPSVTELLESPPLKDLVNRVSHNVVVTSVRSFLDEVRADLHEAAQEVSLPSVAELAERIARRIQQGEVSRLRPVINATGILLHTGLGRAPLAQAAIEEIASLAGDYSSLELDLPSGQRSQRTLAAEGLIRQLTGAEAAAVVNNNAGATMLALGALAAGREVIVSRGELIEIGGSFRLPDVMQTSGALLREVGTTNKTRIDDYRRAVSDKTALFLLVHTSNYRVVGFSESVDLAELVALGHECRIPVVHDIGSGALIDFAPFGCPDEPVATASLKAGADLVLFSGDKLLGGPQCGIIAGRRKLVETCARHPMMRALRVDKLTLAALAATLRLYRNPDQARREVPLLILLDTSCENLKNRAERLSAQLSGSPGVATTRPQADVAYLGGGSVPTHKLDTWCVVVKPARVSVEKAAIELRNGSPSVVPRVHDDCLWFDLRSVFPRQDQTLLAAVQSVLRGDSTET